jgi:hypothetical protein
MSREAWGDPPTVDDREPCDADRPLTDRLRDCAQGVDLGADGIGWAPDPVPLLREAAAEIERLRAELQDMHNDRNEWMKRWQVLADKAGNVRPA